MEEVEGGGSVAVAFGFAVAVAVAVTVTVVLLVLVLLSAHNERFSGLLYAVFFCIHFLFKFFYVWTKHTRSVKLKPLCPLN